MEFMRGRTLALVWAVWPETLALSSTLNVLKFVMRVVESFSKA